MESATASVAPVDRLSATFFALADPTRRAILARLSGGEASVLELAKPFDMSQPAISKHLKILERAGLVSSSQAAQRRPRRLEARLLGEATQWLERYREHWEANFARLDAVLEEMQSLAPAKRRPSAARTFRTPTRKQLRTPRRKS